MASISSKQYKYNRRAVPFRKLLDCSAPHLQECLNRQGVERSYNLAGLGGFYCFDVAISTTLNEREMGKKSR